MKVVSLDELKADPATAAQRAFTYLGPVDRVVVHLDVDVIDFAEYPLSEGYRYGEGYPLAQAMTAFSTIASKHEFGSD